MKVRDWNQLDPKGSLLTGHPVNRTTKGRDTLPISVLS